MINFDHYFDIEDMKLIKYVKDPFHLDAYESIRIQRETNKMNSDDGPIAST